MCQSMSSSPVVPASAPGVPVALQRLAPDDRSAVAQALPRLLDRAGLASSFSLRSARVLVKPNLLTATPLACTSPVVVAAVCRWLLDQGARVRVGDSPGFGTATAVARQTGLAEALRPDDFIIACDAGYRNCAPLGRRPNIIVGDFDTAPCPEQQDDDIIVLPHVKDDTDTEYAAKLVSEKGFDEVLLLGGLGGRRVEHTLANLCTGLGLEQRGVRTTLLDERSRITYVMPGETRRYPKEKYFFSAFPMEGRAQGVCERGSYYELTDAELTASYPLGVSNEYAAGSDCITISTRSGALVVVETIAD